MTYTHRFICRPLGAGQQRRPRVGDRVIVIDTWRTHTVEAVSKYMMSLGGLKYAMLKLSLPGDRVVSPEESNLTFVTETEYTS